MESNRNIYQKDHALALLPKSDQDEIYNNLYNLYYNYLKYKQSDITTKELLKYEASIKRPRSARRLIISSKPELKRFLNNSLWDLFSLCYVDKARSRILKELSVSTKADLVTVRRAVRDRGLVPHVFEEITLRQVLEAVTNKYIIEEIDIAEKVKDPLFRFITKDNPVESVAMSDALYAVYQDGYGDAYKNTRTITPEMQKMATDKLKENADSFAIRMHDVVKQIQEKENVTSFRETVRVLNKNHIPSYRGGEWHLGSIQQLEKRWKSLGLIPDKTKPK